MVRLICNVYVGPQQRANEPSGQIKSTTTLNSTITSGTEPPPTDDRVDEVIESQPSETFK